MHKAFASLISLLGLIIVIGYMASEAHAQAATDSDATVAAAPIPAPASPAAPRAANTRKLKKQAVVRRTAYHPSMHRGMEGKSTDLLALRSNAALVLDQSSGEVLYEKNSATMLPIASITKLMTAMVVLDAKLPLDESIDIDREDLDTEKGTRSRLQFGTTMTRLDAMHLALMASENRAASSLGRHYPGGIDAFVAAMNTKARVLGMTNTQYVDANGLSPRNQSTASDLARLVEAAYAYPLIRELSTSQTHSVQVGRRMVAFRNTNRLTSSNDWDIGLQKTGYISEAGRCLVMQATIAGRAFVMVLLDSWGKYTRLGDASRIREWIKQHPAASAHTVTATAAPSAS